MTLFRKLRSTLVALSLAGSTLAATTACAGVPGPQTNPENGMQAGSRPTPDARRITLNGRPATARDLQILARFEQAWGQTIPSGDYWYDNASGAAGWWGGPTRGFLGAGLGLGGALPANASGGGQGMLTGVFINGRELHPLDVQGLTQLFGQPPWPGQWWVDGAGNFGAPGQPALGNLIALVQMRQRSRGGGGGSSYYKSDIGTGSSTFVGSGCAAVHARTNPSSSDSSSYSYYVGCE